MFYTIVQGDREYVLNEEQMKKSQFLQNSFEDLQTNVIQLPLSYNISHFVEFVHLQDINVNEELKVANYLDSKEYFDYLSKKKSLNIEETLQLDELTQLETYLRLPLSLIPIKNLITFGTEEGRNFLSSWIEQNKDNLNFKDYHYTLDNIGKKTFLNEYHNGFKRSFYWYDGIPVNEQVSYRNNEDEEMTHSITWYENGLKEEDVVYKLYRIVPEESFFWNEEGEDITEEVRENMDPTFDYDFDLYLDMRGV